MHPDTWQRNKKVASLWEEETSSSVVLGFCFCSFFGFFFWQMLLLFLVAVIDPCYVCCVILISHFSIRAGAVKKSDLASIINS